MQTVNQLTTEQRRRLQEVSWDVFAAVARYNLARGRVTLRTDPRGRETYPLRAVRVDQG